MILDKQTFDKVRGMFPGFGEPCYTGYFNGQAWFAFSDFSSPDEKDWRGFVARIGEDFVCREIRGLRICCYSDWEKRGAFTPPVC